MSLGEGGLRHVCQDFLNCVFIVSHKQKALVYTYTRGPSALSLGFYAYAYCAITAAAASILPQP